MAHEMSYANVMRVYPILCFFNLMEILCFQRMFK